MIEGALAREDDAAAQSGEALAHALAALHERSYAWALSCTGWARDEALDVLQGVYLEVLEGRARFEGRAALRTWLFAVIRRQAASRRRTRWLRALVLERRPDATPPPPEPVQLVEERERTQRVRRALGRLPARQREVLELVFFQDLTIEEAAVVMGVSVGSARVHYARGKDRLRKELP